MLRLNEPLLYSFIFACITALVYSCPEAVSGVCHCKDLHNGVDLNCSNTNGAEVIQILRSNQALLGLVQTLTMYNANIRRIPPSFLAGLYIKKLDFSYNHMVDVDKNAFSGMNPVLQELILSHNNLTRVPSAAMTELTSLLKLDLSNNSIIELTEQDAFPPLMKLYDVNFAGNKISNVHTSVFQPIKNSLQVINFGHNLLSSVPSSSIRGLKGLQSLHLHKNNISNLEALSFLNLPVLNLLNLAGNHIQEVNRQAFLNVPALRYLYLTNNEITKLAAHQFSSFEQLEMLDLTGNRIEMLPAECLSALPQLRQLYLGNNKIARIEKDAFTNSSIVILVLANNYMKELTEGVVSGLGSLQKVSLKNNSIQSIDQNAFYNDPSLDMIDLSENQLVDVPAGTFMAQLNKVLINLSKNKFPRTPYNAFNRRAGTVMLQENPLVCSEKVHMLQDGVGIYLPDSEDIVCGGTPKPSTTTTTSTTTTAAPKLVRKLLPTRLSTGDVPSGAFEAAGLIPKRIHAPKTDEIPTRPSPIEEGARPAILNMRPNRPSITRSRGPIGSDLATVPTTENTQAQEDLENVEDLMSQLNDIEKKEAELNAALGQAEKEGDSDVEDASETADNQPTVPQSELPELPEANVPVESQPAQEERPQENQNREEVEVRKLPARTTTLGPRVYTDIADNPNLIHPFPVPFLKRGPQIHQATRIRMTSPAPVEESGETTELHTLPPSIVIAPRTRPTPTKDVEKNLVTSPHEDDEKFEQFALRASTALDKEDLATKAPQATVIASSTFIVIVCLVTVGTVMAAVFVGLCIARHRQTNRLGSSCSDSSAARTNAYVNSQSAQMGPIYGTAGRSGLQRPDDAQPWIYNPGMNYCNYYK